MIIHKAMDEGLMELAHIFRQIAGSETVRALSHLKVMGFIIPQHYSGEA